MYEKFAFSKNPPTALLFDGKEVDLPIVAGVQIASYEEDGALWVGVRCDDPELLEAVTGDICTAMGNFGKTYVTANGTEGIPNLKVIAGTYLDADPTSLAYDLAYAPYYGIEQAEGRIEREVSMPDIFAMPYGISVPGVVHGPRIVCPGPNRQQITKEKKQ